MDLEASLEQILESNYQFGEMFYDVFFEQHDCPENFLKDVRAVYLDGESDPHGLFDFVGVEPEDVIDKETPPHR